MNFKDLESSIAFVDRHAWNDGVGTLRWYVVGEQERRDAAVHALKSRIDGKLMAAVKDKSLLFYASDIVDIAAADTRGETLRPVLQKLRAIAHHHAFGKRQTAVYLPFFLNADAHRNIYNNLGQELFDMGAPGVLALGKKGYIRTTNASKRDTFHALFLDCPELYW